MDLRVARRGAVARALRRVGCRLRPRSRRAASGARRKPEPNDVPISPSPAPRSSMRAVAPVSSASLLPRGGHTRLVGFDLSTGMLERSAARGVYPSCTRVRCWIDCRSTTAGSGRSCRSECSRSAMSTARRSPNLARVTAPGGHVSITFRDDAVDRLGYRAEQQRLIDVRRLGVGRSHRARWR